MVFLKGFTHHIFVIIFCEFYFVLDSDEMVFESVDFHVTFSPQRFQTFIVTFLLQFRNFNVLIEVTLGEHPLIIFIPVLHFDSLLIGADDKEEVFFRDFVGSIRVFSW